MDELPAYVEGLPNLCGSEGVVEEAIRAGRSAPVTDPDGAVQPDKIDSAFAIALMYQPLIPAGGTICGRHPSSAT